MGQNKIVVTGGSGMVGRSLKDIMPNGIYLSSKDYYGKNAYVTSELNKMILYMGYIIAEKTPADTLYVYNNFK